MGTELQYPSGPWPLMKTVYSHLLPQVDKALERLRHLATAIPDPELRRQALDSLQYKQFHCQGGSVYAAPNVERRTALIDLIVSFQTISDYLDNLCDRSTSLDGKDFAQLHEAMLDAVQPERPLQLYYALHDEQDDGGYLQQLVRDCRLQIAALPSYKLVQDSVVEWVGLYRDLQVYKHIQPDRREQALQTWHAEHQARWPALSWFEFSAACGSTLGIFQLFLLASQRACEPKELEQIQAAYFPYVCAVHIMLDYLIDQQEDRDGGDLNFCLYYPDDETKTTRMLWLVEQARQAVESVQGAAFHRMVIEGLLALYLSDPKVKHQLDVREISQGLIKGSPLSRVFFKINSIFIRKVL